MPSQKHRKYRNSVKSELNSAILIDPGLSKLVDELGYPTSRNRFPGYATLAEIINAQQLSTKAAAAIWFRLEQHCRGQVTARKIYNRSNDQLKKCGLSERKVSYLKDLANMVVSDRMMLDALPSLPDQEIIRELMKIRGLGRWSAEIYTMFALDRQDIFPAGDLALQVAVQRYKNMRTRPDETKTRKISEIWTPHRTSVALLMWRYYGSTTLG